MSDSDVRIDSKGKYYTKIISTDVQEVLIRMHSGELIRGLLHVRPDRRLSDEINGDQMFLSITDASVQQGDSENHRPAYIAVNRAQVEWMIPVDALEQDGDA